MGRISIVEYCGLAEEGTCGYCKNVGRKNSLGASAAESSPSSNSQLTEDSDNQGDSYSFGAWGHFVSVHDYQHLLDCGWRRSGQYLYKPTMAKTCCPQYTIRLDVTKFAISRTQKKVLRNMNEYLQHDRKPKGIKEECSKDIGKNSQKTDVSSKSETSKPEKLSKKEVIDGEKPMKKKKEMRRERAIFRWQKKGLDVEQIQRERTDKEKARARTIKSYIDEAQDDWKHKLEVRLVRTNSAEYESRADETFELYDRYQQTIHKDKRSSRDSYQRFLERTPLFDDPNDRVPNSPALGSYQQHYLLDGKLIAVGVVDALPRCYSSKYLFYDPDYAFLSLGTYTALREIEFIQNTLMPTRPSLKYYYMGYYIESCPKMRYKGKFLPSELLCDQSFTWVPLSECRQMLSANEGRYTIFNPDALPAPRLSIDRVCVYRNKVVYEWEILKNEWPDLDKEEIRNKLSIWANCLGKDGGKIVLFLPELQLSADADNDGDNGDSSDS